MPRTRAERRAELLVAILADAATDLADERDRFYAQKQETAAAHAIERSARQTLEREVARLRNVMERASISITEILGAHATEHPRSIVASLQGVAQALARAADPEPS